MIPPRVRIHVCTIPQDMRRSFDGLARAVREQLDDDPEGGSVFVFINKRANRIKAIWFDRNGYCILYKRLHRSLFLPPASTERSRPVATIDGARLAKLFAGVAKPPRLTIKWHESYKRA